MRAPRWLGLLTALVALGGGSGCPEGPCFSTPSTLPPGGRLVAMGQRASIRVLTGAVTSCDGDGPTQRPESVTVEVYGPENQPIPATVELSSDAVSATIDFTPPVTGRYHVLVAFAPVGSLQQFSVFVAEDRRREAPMATFLSEVACSHVDRTRNGTWLCGSRALRTPDGASQQLGGIVAGPTVVAGNVVWTVDGNQVLRFEDTGSGPLVLTGTAAFPARSGENAGVHTRLATETELVLVTDSLLHRYTFTPESGIGSAQVTPWGNPRGLTFADTVAALLVRAGERLLVVSLEQDPLTFAMRTQACPFQASTTGYVPVRGEPCQPIDGTPVGFEEGVLWTLTSSTSGSFLQTLRRYVATNGQLAEEGGLPLEGQLSIGFTSLRPGPAVPVLTEVSTFSGTVVAPVWNPQKGAVEVELLPNPPEGNTQHAGGNYLWTDSHIGSSVTVYPRVRPSTP